MSSNEYLIVFDTNVLYVPYRDRADFTIFHFNSTFRNIIDKIEELDLYEHIKVGVPVVVWEEMKKQKCEAYYNKINEVKQKINKFKFPFCQLVEDEQCSCYEEYLADQISLYREQLNQRLVKMVDLDLPSNHRFESIIKRAFEKRPPFEGIESHSDKGFKDALLWESILEYKIKNINVDIILYSDDKLFCNELIKEFKEDFNGADITIFNKNEEGKIIKELEKIAKEIDKYIYIEDTCDEEDNVRLWVYSEQFAQQIIAFEPDLKIVNKYTKLKSVSVEEVFDIEKFETENDIIQDIQISLKLKFKFNVQDKITFEELYDTVVYANIIDGIKIEIDDISIEEGGGDIE